MTREMVRPGTFVAAVGADNEDKQEIDPALLAAAKVVTDLTAQAAAIGDLHHAIAARVMSAADVHAELGEIICGRKPGGNQMTRRSVFDRQARGFRMSAAIAAYRAAVAEKSRHS